MEAQLGVTAPKTTGKTSAPAEEDAKQIRAFDAYCRECLDPFVAACKALSPEASTCGEIVTKGWMGMRSFLVMASKCKKPSQWPAAVQGFLKPCQEAMQEASANVSRGDWECHQKTISEGLQCMSWLLVEPAPRDFIENFIGGQDFWANKIRVKYKKTEPKQIAYCDTFKKLITELMPYVKEYHMTGVTYNPKGVDVASYAPSAPPAAPAAPTASAKPASGGGGGLGDLKTALGGGGSVTSGLKKVTKDMQTWRAEYKGGGDVPKAKAIPKPAAKKQTVTRGPPVFEFQQQRDEVGRREPDRRERRHHRHHGPDQRRQAHRLHLHLLRRDHRHQGQVQGGRRRRMRQMQRPFRLGHLFSRGRQLQVHEVPGPR